jgi:hypothetical protein
VDDSSAEKNRDEYHCSSPFSDFLFLQLFTTRSGRKVTELSKQLVSTFPLRRSNSLTDTQRYNSTPHSPNNAARIPSMLYICNGGVVNCVACQSRNGTCGKDTTVMPKTSLPSFSVATIPSGTSMQDQQRKRAEEAAEKMQLVNQQIADTAERWNELKARQKEEQDEEGEHNAEAAAGGDGAKEKASQGSGGCEG